MSRVTVQNQIKPPLFEDFEAIYREFATLVYRTAWGVMGSPEDAEDVLQTVFLKLLRQEFPADLHKNPKAYLYRAAVTVSLDVLKARRRRPLVLMDTAEDLHVDVGAADSVFNEALHQQLYEAISRLNPGSAEVVILRYMQNQSTDAIAKTLGISRTAVAVRLFRSRARLKKLLRDIEEES